MSKLTKILVGGLVLVLAIVGLVSLLNRPEAEQSNNLGTKVDTLGDNSFSSSLGGMKEFQTYTFFATSTTQTYFGTSTNATSTGVTAFTNSDGRRIDGKFVVAGAKRVSMLFGRGDVTGTGNTGSSQFMVEVSPDGTNWYDFNRLITATNTFDGFSTQTILPSVEIGAGSSSTVMADLDLSDAAIYAIRCIVLETTDGDHTCRASADWSEQ